MNQEKRKEKILEDLSIKIRRRISFNKLKDILDFLVLVDINPCDYVDPGEFISDACDYLKNLAMEKSSELLTNISPKEKDQFYYQLVDIFGKHLFDFYTKRCVKGLK